MVPLVPTELILSILAYCDGPTLATCQLVCRQWRHLIDHYDSLVWSSCCKRDFEKGVRRRFWSLEFPDPQRVENAMLSSSSSSGTLWQSLYRVTKRWSLGDCTASFLSETPLGSPRLPCVVVGTTHEYYSFTSLSITQSGHIVRSNPMYKGNTQGRQAMVIQSSFGDGEDGQVDLSSFYYLEDNDLHGIVCHYSDPTSHWIVTGGLDGTVSLWNELERRKARTWQGHRSRVLCVSMNDQVVISGGADSMIRVWELDGANQRGSIDISSYISDQHDWFQGVGEIALNGHLIACAPDASGPVLIFSLLTGSLVYELKTEPQDVAFTRLCLTPYYLLTKGEIRPSNQHQVPIYPSSASTSSTSASYTSSSIPSPPPTATPYQLSQYFSSLEQRSMARSCVDVWDLHTGKLAYRLVPPLSIDTAASITDIKVSPNAAHVFACVEIRGNGSRQNKLCCWDFSNQQLATPSIKILPPMPYSVSSYGNAWACFY